MKKRKPHPHKPQPHDMGKDTTTVIASALDKSAAFQKTTDIFKGVVSPFKGTKETV